MKPHSESREVFTLQGSIRGTCHKPRATASGAGERVGVLFLNGLPSTRAGRGDAAVQWADAIAHCGYPAFRLDMPGFGDSAGEPPADWLSFINKGGFGETASRAIDDLVAKFELRKIVLIGHCAGAVSAIYGTALNRNCCGLVLVDPYFYAAEVERPKSRQHLSDWADRSRLGGVLRSVFGPFKATYLFFFRNRYPDNANVPLLRRWKEIGARRIPIMILRAPDRKATKPRPGEFDYFRYVVGLAGQTNRLEMKIVEGANHTFSNERGRQSVCDEAQRWLSEHFPTDLNPRSDAPAASVKFAEDSRQFVEVGSFKPGALTPSGTARCD